MRCSLFWLCTTIIIIINNIIDSHCKLQSTTLHIVYIQLLVINYESKLTIVHGWNSFFWKSYTLILAHKVSAVCMNIIAMHMQSLRESSHHELAALDRCAEHFGIRCLAQGHVVRTWCTILNIYFQMMVLHMKNKQKMCIIIIIISTVVGLVAITLFHLSTRGHCRPSSHTVKEADCWMSQPAAGTSMLCDLHPLGTARL